MTKRESGWYRVRFVSSKIITLAKFVSRKNKWMTISDSNVYECELAYIDPQMVMTPSGEMVYHNQHDPLYNTKQEG